MTFDKPEHKALVLELIAAANFPGPALDTAYEFKKAAEAAEIVPPTVE